ncbi:hypothetical protein [Pedobacter rhizosphaerae]|uniref:Lipoprotein n=1 Tax=Pedobacter rhizosphaerae TaxID=390241 RepID=A0A1H9QR49_9SPHI|nr:hypothetical protein [Pedobacter rhizosphaerae]SER62928.1 hypothetical protein SAMN04488023_112110 [Pedobacter rhizosphaerae]
MKTPVYLFICLLLLACSSGPKQPAQDIDTTGTSGTIQNQVPFDLAKLKLKEDIHMLLSGISVKPEISEAIHTTLVGFETFKSSNPKVLRFHGSELALKNNYVLFHYEVKDKKLAAYELFINNWQQTDVLINSLKKIVKPVFSQTGNRDGAIELDEQGDETTQGQTQAKTFRVWENANTGLSYFLSTSGTGKNLSGKLTVLNPTSPFGKDWMSSQALNWYKNAKSEPF